MIVSPRAPFREILTGTTDIVGKLKSGDESQYANARKYFMDLYSAVMTAHDSRVPLLTMMDGITRTTYLLLR